MVSLNRRSFIKLTGTTVVCTCLGALGTGGRAGSPTSDTPSAPPGSYRFQDGRVYVDLTQLGTLLGVGEAVKCRVQDMEGREQKVIVVRPSEADFRAFADACTHNGKELDYLREVALLACSGRGSRFDLAGNVVQGPAEEALLSLRVWQGGGRLGIEI